jgi:phage tail-like protein
MSVAAYLPPPARPPHDPLLTRLGRHDGWRPAPGPFTHGVQIGTGNGDLTLELVSPPGPGLLDPFGTLGGLVPPPFTALTPDGSLYLLDRTGGRLLWFDPCACRFLPLPCLDPPGPADPRNLPAPVAIAAGRQHLVLADGSDGGPVLVLARHDLAVIEVLRRDWQPNLVAEDGCARLYVADAKHGSVHRFAPGGRYLGGIEGVGRLVALAIDCEERLYLASSTTVRRYTSAGLLVDEVSDIGSIRGCFRNLPFALDGKGRLVLAELCRANGSTPPGKGVFNPSGEPLPSEKPTPHAAAIWAGTGRYLSQAIDSRIYGCTWHRILLEVDLPERTRLTVRTRNDELEMPLDLVEPPANPAWSSAQMWRGPLYHTVELLVTSTPGRFLWLELVLEGLGSATPRVGAITFEFPRISLRRYLPAVLGADPVSADFTDRLLAIFDQAFRSVERQLDRLPALFDPRSTPSAMLDWLAGIVGLVLPPSASLAERRRLLREAPRLYASRGTPAGLRDLLILYLGLDRVRCARRPCPFGPTFPPDEEAREGLPKLILEHWRLRRWLVLGRGKLGEGSTLWGERILNRSQLDTGMQLGSTQLKLERDPLRDPFHAYAHVFSVFLPGGRARRPAARRRIEALIRREAPAHTRPIVHWVEPNLRLGLQSTLGFDTVLGMPPPTPLQLGTSKLGRASTIKPHVPAETGLELRRNTRLGATTRLG